MVMWDDSSGKESNCHVSWKESCFGPSRMRILIRTRGEMHSRDEEVSVRI